MDTAPLVTNSQENVEDRDEESLHTDGCCKKFVDTVRANDLKFIVGFALFLVLLAAGIVVGVILFEGSAENTTSSPDPVTMTTTPMMPTTHWTTSTSAPGVCGGFCVISFQCRQRSGNQDCSCSWKRFSCGTPS